MALMILAQQANHLQIVLLALCYQIIVSQIICNNTNGVDGVLCVGCMAADTCGINAYTLGNCSQCNAVSRRKLCNIALYNGISLVRNRILSHTALKVQNSSILKLFAGNIAAQMSLLTIAQRELGVWCKQEYRLLIVVNVIFYI